MVSNLVTQSMYMSNKTNNMKHFKFFFIYTLICIFPMSSQILFSEYAEGTSYNKYLEIYNYSSNTVDLTQYAFPSCSNGCDSEGEWDYMNFFPEGALVNPGAVYVITHPNATSESNAAYNPELAIYSDHTFTYLSNGNDVFALINIETNEILDIIGDMSTEDITAWDVAGVTNATKDHTLVRKSTVMVGNAGYWSASAGTNVDDSEWIVFDNEIWDNLGFHNYDNNNNSDVFGCTDSLYIEYNPDANIDDGSCQTLIVEGCTDSSALNYNPEANINDGSCQYEEVYISGCYWCDLAANYFDFNYQSTISNMTIAISDVSNLISGDVLGVFYTNPDGFMTCGGAEIFDNNQLTIAAWGDDPSTAVIDGFQLGDAIIFLVFRDEIVYELEVTLSSSPPFANTYANSAFGQVLELDISNEFIEECILPLGTDDCESNMIEQKPQRELMFTIDALGRIVNNNFQGVCFRLYDDGKIEKKYLLNH